MRLASWLLLSTKPFERTLHLLGVSVAPHDTRAKPLDVTMRSSFRIGLMFTSICLGFGCSSGPELTASAEAPAQVEVGTEFDVKVSLTNPHKEAVELDSIDIDLAALSELSISSLDPKPTDEFDLPIFEQRSFIFDQAVEPGGTIVVTIGMTAETVKAHQLPLDICNDHQDCSTIHVQLDAMSP